MAIAMEKFSRMCNHWSAKLISIVLIIQLGIVLKEYTYFQDISYVSSHRIENTSNYTINGILTTSISNTTDHHGLIVQNCSCPNSCTNKVLDRIIITNHGNNKNVSNSCRQLIQYLIDSRNSNTISERDACIQAFNTNQSYNICGVECDPTKCYTNASIIKNQSVPIQKNQSVSIQNIDLVVVLSGELGNHLYKIAMAKSMQLLAEEYNYPIQFTFRYLGQGRGKSRTPAKEIPKCFPSLQNANFKECNVPSYKNILSQQEHLYGKDKTILAINSYLQGDWRNTTKEPISGVQNMFNFVLNSIKEERSIPFHQLQSILDDTDILPLNIPFLLADTFCLPQFLDKYQIQIQEFFTFNYSSPFCCSEKPDANETVLHIRGFVTEMPKTGKKSKYKELDPERVANELLGHLKVGEKVVLLSRFTKTLKPYKKALRTRGLIVRTVTGQSGVQDFCFLMSTRKELVGMLQSTYVFWASVLSSTVQNVTLYRTVDYPKEFVPKYNKSKMALYQFPVY